MRRSARRSKNGTSKQSPPLGGGLDPESAEAFLTDLLGSRAPLKRSRRRTRLEQAQEIVQDAWDTDSTEKRRSMARKALAVSEDCADAWVMLADETARTLD